MFLEIEGELLINITLISRVELNHRTKSAKMFNAGVYEGDSEIAYRFFTDPGNADYVKVPRPKEVANGSPAKPSAEAK